LDEVMKNIDKSVRILEGEKRKALEKIGWAVEEQVVHNIDRAKAIDTGKFKQSIHHVVGSGTVNKPGGKAKNKQGKLVEWTPYSISHSEDDNTLTVADGVHYGVYVEYGTVRMKPRPVMRPAAEERKREIQDILREMVENSMKK